MKSVILAANGVQDEEFIYPYYRLQEEGTVIVSMTPKKGNHNGVCKYGVPIRSDIPSEELMSHIDADLVIIPGGWECPELLRMDKFVIQYLQHMNNRAVIGAICHGPQVLISADLVRDKMVSGYVGIKDDIENAGGVYFYKTKRHGLLITAPHYNDNSIFLKACIDAVRECNSAKTLG